MGWIFAIGLFVFFFVSVIIGAGPDVQTTTLWTEVGLSVTALLFFPPAYWLWARPFLRRLGPKHPWWFGHFLFALGCFVLSVLWIGASGYAPYFMSEQTVETVRLLHNESRMLPGARRPYRCHNYLTFERPGAAPQTRCVDTLVDGVIPAPGEGKLAVRHGWPGTALMHLAPG
ncbi:MAG TPA: hypothetical protein VGN52_20920 [Burkholderiales bacterium]|jgi:hypothetical protein